MHQKTKRRLYTLLRWSEKYVKADMVYLASGQFWLILGRIVGISSGLALTYVFANFLDPTDFGTYKYVLAVAGFIGAFTLGGIGTAITRSVALGKAGVVPTVSRLALLWSLPAGLAALIGAIYYLWNANFILGAGLLFAAFSIPLSNVFGLYKSIMIGQKDFKNLALSSFRSLIPIIGLITVILLGGDIVVILATYFVLNLLVSGSMYFWSLRQYRIATETVTSDDARHTVQYGKHLSIMGIVSQATDSLDQLLLWHFAGPVQLAVYSFALAPIREIRNFSQNIYPLLFPKYVTKTILQMKESVPLRVKQLTIASALIGIIYIALAPSLFHLVFPKYINAILFSQILAIGLLLQARGIVDTMLYAQGNARLRYITTGVTQGAKVILWVILIPLYGIAGAVIGSVVADIVSSLIFWWAYRKVA